MASATWEPNTKHGELSTKQKNDLPESVFAFPKQRKEPLTHAEHVQNALARFDQVKGVSDADRDIAFANIKKARRSRTPGCTGILWTLSGSFCSRFCI